MRFALCGAGFWAPFQLAGWKEVGAECAAICDPDRMKAEALAKKAGLSAVYGGLQELLREVRVDFVDVVTPVETHAELVAVAAGAGLPVVCQKPLARSMSEAEAIVRTCHEAGVPLLVNENWRWQSPIRALKQMLDRGPIGRPFRARIEMKTGFPVFRNQPFLAELNQFIISDLGTHLLDVARFLFGEAESVYCHTQRVHREIRGEDVATVVLKMRSGATVLVEMAYAENHLEREHYPETFVFVEAEKGSAEIAPDFSVRETTVDGTRSRRVAPIAYEWASPALIPVHESIVPCQRHLLSALRGEVAAETTGEDNLRTLRLVFGAYESAESGKAVAV